MLELLSTAVAALLPVCAFMQLLFVCCMGHDALILTHSSPSVIKEGYREQLPFFEAWYLRPDLRYLRVQAA